MDLVEEYYSSDSSDEEKNDATTNDDREMIPVPVYSEDELGKLLLYIQQISTSYELQEDEISDSFKQQASVWLHNIREPTLFVYFDQGCLSASLGCPVAPVSHATYFIREQRDHMFTVDGFHEEISFGTFSENVDETMLHLMTKLFAPVIINDHWTEEVKAKLFNDLHLFIANLTDVSSRLGDTIILYIPNEGLDLTVKQATKDKGLVKRYENVLGYWTSQIRAFIKDTDDSYENMKSPDDERRFFLHKLETLDSVVNQINSKDIDFIIKVLRKFESPFISSFDVLLSEVSANVINARINSKFLKLLLEPFDDLKRSGLPKDLPAKLPNIIYLIRVISLNCEYYDDRLKTERLFGFLSNVVIDFCKAHIDIPRILSGEPRFGIRICDMSIDCCVMYKLIFQRLVQRLQEKDFRETWAHLDEKKIFKKVDTFIQRLNDLMEICEAIIVFSRKDETIKIPSIVLGGHQGQELTNICRDIEKQFAVGLSAIEGAPAILLDVDSSDWYPKMSEFKDLLVLLDGFASKVITQAFTNASNVEEVLDSLTTLHSFSKRETLRSLYEEKVESMWTIFETEVRKVSKEVTSSHKHMTCVPPFAGKAIDIRIKMKKFERLRDLLVSAQYLPQFESTKTKLQTYEVTMESFKVMAEGSNEEWSKGLNEEPESYLKNFLINRSSSRNGWLECNINRDVLKVFDEANHFVLIEAPLPALLAQLYPKAQTVVGVFNKVVNVVQLYNKMLDSLSTQERMLFRQHIKAMDKKVQPGVVRLTFGDLTTDEYITECLKHLAETQHFINIYKIVNSVNMKLFGDIAGGLILNLNVDSVLKLDEFNEQFKDSRNAATIEIGSIYKRIIKYIFLVFEGFERHLTNDIALKWIDFIRRVDALAEFSILCCARSTALGVLNLLNDKSSPTPKSLIAIDIVLQDDRIQFQPSMESLTESLTRICDDIIKSVKIFPRLTDVLNLPSNGIVREFYEIVGDDKIFKSYIGAINEVVEITLSQTSDYIDNWLKFRSLWEVQIDNSKYDEKGLNLEEFESNMIQLFDFESEVWSLDEKASVTFVYFDCSKLKKAALECIASWKESFKEALYATAARKLEIFNDSLTSRVASLHKPPTSHAELEELSSLCKRSTDELQRRLEDTKVIKNYFSCLNKNNIYLQPAVKQSFEAMPERLVWYKEQLELTKESLSEQKKRGIFYS